MVWEMHLPLYSFPFFHPTHHFPHRSFCNPFVYRQWSAPNKTLLLATGTKSGTGWFPKQPETPFDLICSHPEMFTFLWQDVFTDPCNEPSARSSTVKRRILPALRVIPLMASAAVCSTAAPSLHEREGRKEKGKKPRFVPQEELVVFLSNREKFWLSHTSNKANLFSLSETLKIYNCSGYLESLDRNVCAHA